MEKPAESPESLAARVRRTLQDLTAIRESLAQAAAPTEEQSTTPPSSLNLELASELKSVVDTLRELLWAYISALSAKSGRRPHEVLDWYKTELALEMLRNSRDHQASSADEAEENPSTFEQLVANALTVTAMHPRTERHC